MNDEKLILEIYNKIIANILMGIDEKYKEELKISYLEYLKRLYLNINVDLKNKNINQLISLFTDLEISKWKDTLPEMRLSELLSDKALENIKYISNTGYKYAKLMIDKNFRKNENEDLQPVIDVKKAQESIEMLNSYYSQVREFNKNIAAYYVSEGSLDFQFAGGITKNMSLRVGKMK